MLKCIIRLGLGVSALFVMVGCSSAPPNFDDNAELRISEAPDRFQSSGEGGGLAFPEYPYEGDVSSGTSSGNTTDVTVDGSDGVGLLDVADDGSSVESADILSDIEENAIADSVGGDVLTIDAESDAQSQDTDDAEDDGSVNFADVAPLIGLSCEQIMGCFDLCVYKEGAERIACQETCAINGKSEVVIETAQSYLDCLKANACESSVSDCSVASCTDEALLCANDGVIEVIDPSQPPEKCGGTDGVVCPEKVLSPLQIEVEHVSVGAPPQLSGGDLGDGIYGLTLVQVYSASMLFGGLGSIPVNFDFQIKDSDGSIHIDGDSWNYFSDINVSLSVAEVGSADYVSLVEGGGCLSLYEGNIVSDIMQCYTGNNPSDEFSPYFPYEVDGAKIRILLSVPNQYILNGLEGVAPNVIALAKTLFVNDLQILLTLTKM